MLLFDCGYDCPRSELPEFNVFDSDNEEVFGGIVKEGSVAEHWWVAWQPEQPLAADATYVVQLVNLGRWEFDTKQVALDPEPMQLTFSATPMVAGTGSRVCCQGSPNTMWCHGQPCFYSQRQDAVLLELKPASSPTGFEFLYRTTFRSGGETTVMPDQPTPAVQLISLTAAKDYCYSLDAIRPATNEVIHIADGCKSLGLSAFVVRPPTDTELRSDLSECAHAPAGFEADWERLGLQDKPGGRQTATSRPTPDTSEDAALGIPSSEQGDHFNEADAGPSRHAQADSGCSLSQRDQPGQSLLLLLFLPLLLARAKLSSRRRHPKS